GIEQVSAHHNHHAQQPDLPRFRADLHNSLPASPRTKVSRRSVTVSRFPVLFGVATMFEMMRKRCDLSSRLMSFARFVYWPSYTSEMVICHMGSEPSTGSRLMESPFGVTPAS